jgi:RNA polymerase-binding protein DksA
MKRLSNKRVASRRKVARVRPAASAGTILQAVASPARRAAEGKINPKWLRYHRKLLALRERLLRDRSDLANNSAREEERFSMDMADAATDDFDRDLTLSELSSEQDALYEVEEAIKRIESGAYGVCEITGKPIPAARLAAVPWTRFTAEAKARLEQSGEFARPHLGQLGSVQAAPDELDQAELGEAEEAAAPQEGQLRIFHSPSGPGRAPRRRPFRGRSKDKTQK